MANGANTNRGSKGQFSMQIQSRRRLGLLSRVSTLAIIAAAAGGLGSVQQAEAAGCTTTNNVTAPTTITTNVTCVTVTTEVTGDIVNAAHVGDPGPGYLVFFVGSGGIVDGQIWNKSTISGGYPSGGEGSGFGAITIADGGNVLSGILNTGQILSGANNAIQIGTSSVDGVSSGSLSGGITNDSVISGFHNGIALIAGSFSGGLVNNSNGVISGGDAGVFVSDRFDASNTWFGGITNYGSILGDSAGIQIGTLQGGEGWIQFHGGIYNFGEVSSLNGPAIFVNGMSFDGGLWNYGVITQRGAGGEGTYDGAGVVFDTTTVDGGIHNFNRIDGVSGPGVWVTDDVQNFNGDIENTWSIDGNDVGVLMQAHTVSGNFSNSGWITGGSTGVAYSDNTIHGSGGEGATFTNTGSITGGDVGFEIAANNVTADFTNGDAITHQGYISGGSSTGVVLSFATWHGNITNNGIVSGGEVGMRVGGYDPFLGKDPRGTLTGNIVNNLTITGGSTGLLVSLGELDGNITNTGSIHGGTYGVYVDVDKFVGNFDNTSSGIIDPSLGGEGSAALRIGRANSSGASSQTYTGDISNEGLISGAHNGVAIILKTYDGSGGEGFKNSGSIVGTNSRGVYIDVQTWKGDITNATGGYIAGGVTGFFMNAGSIAGDFTNDGSIVGFGFDTGLYIQTPSYTGNIANGVNGLISAPANAMHLQIDAFSGQISNDGSIVAPSGNAVVISGFNTSGVYTGGFTNRGLINGSDIGIELTNASLSDGITNDGGSIIGGSAAISTVNATGPTIITNKGGGIIIGNVDLSTSYVDTFVGENGGITGDINGGGEGNDDKVIVQNGTQYFNGKGGTASNLTSFTVKNLGTAIMGALFEGDPNGTGYSFSNVAAINVNSGGTLYVDKSTTLDAGTYTQLSGGNLEFYLAAPGGSGFSSLTGTQTANPLTDYGHVQLTGAVHLDGMISAFLDPAFASANSGLNSVVYEDVLTTTGAITGDFTTTAIIANTSLFELHEELDGTSAVDLTVTRIPLGQLGGVNDIVVNLGGPWKSMVNDRSNGLGSGSCSLAGAGWCFNAFAANEPPGGTQVMNDASPGTDAFDWLRTGARRVGETAVWGRGVGVWGNTDGDNIGHPGTKFDSYGAIVGVDHVFTPLLMVGAAVQYTKSNIDFSGLSDNANVDSYEVGGYVSYGDARLYLNANASAIFHNISVTRFATGGQAHGDYNGTTASGYAEVGKIFETYEGMRIQPLVALSYAHLDTNSYNETGSAFTKLHVFDATFDSLQSMIGARFAYPIAVESGRKVVPELRAVWAHEFMDDQASFLANPLTNPLAVGTITGEQFNRDSVILGAGVTAPLSDATSVFFDYDATLNTNITANTVSAGLRTRW